MNAILLASAGVVILLVGGGVGYWVGRTGVGGSKAKIEKAEAELDEYKRNVTAHFGQTAAHFQAIGKQYRELYEHMATGAQALCEPDEAGRQLLFAPGDEHWGSLKEVAEDVATETLEAAEQPTVTEEPSADEVPESVEAREEPTDEQLAEIEAESIDAEPVDETVSEAAAEAKPDAPAKQEERTLH